MKLSNPLNLVNPAFKTPVYWALGATGVAAAACLTRWESVKIVGLTMLTAAGYGIANDMIACRDCIEYFTMGHIYQGRGLAYRPIKTLDPTLNAIVWGMMATWWVSSVAGIALAAIARTPFPGLTKKVTAADLAPILISGAVVTLGLAHVKSRAAQKIMLANPIEKYLVPMKFQAGWEACNIRNLTGYQAIFLGGLALGAATAIARTGIVQDLYKKYIAPETK